VSNRSKPPSERKRSRKRAASKKTRSEDEAPSTSREPDGPPSSSSATVEVEPEVLPAETSDPAPPDLLPVARGDEQSTALVPRDALSTYLAEIRQYPILSREEEHELAVRYYEHGDKQAAYRLITSNLRLVVMIAREYQRAFHNLLDLVQEGNVGLLEAVRQFDPYRGVRLPSYAVWWIRAYVIRYVMNNFRLVKVGTTQAQRRLFFNLQKEKARLEAKGFKPTPKRIAQSLGVKEREVIEMDMRMGASEVSADAPAGPESDTSMLDLLPNEASTTEDAVADSEFFGLMTEKIREFGDTLEGRELEIFNERLLAEDPLTLQELGERYGVSRERVRQIEEALRKRLREFLVQQVHDLPGQPMR
jgi:RNA polymerase sigma-32 factor